MRVDFTIVFSGEDYVEWSFPSDSRVRVTREQAQKLVEALRAALEPEPAASVVPKPKAKKGGAA